MREAVPISAQNRSGKDALFNRVIGLFNDRYTQSLRERQANAILNTAQAHRDGFALDKLNDVATIIRLSFDAIYKVNGHCPALKRALCVLFEVISLGFCTDRAWPDEQIQPTIIAIFRQIILISTSHADIGQRLRLSAFSCVRGFINGAKKTSCRSNAYQMTHHGRLQSIADTGAIPCVLAAYLEMDSIQLLSCCGQLIRDLSLSPTTGHVLLSYDNIIPVLLKLLGKQVQFPITSIGVETVWNLFEQCPDRSGIVLGVNSIVISLTHLVSGLLKGVLSARERGIRNQIVCTLANISRVPKIGNAFIVSGCLSKFTTCSVSIELDSQWSSGLYVEDIQMKKLMWTIIGDLVNESRCIGMYAESRLIQGLLVYADISSPKTPSTLRNLIESDLKSLTFTAFSLLHKLVPTLPRVFHRDDGLNKISNHITTSSLKRYDDIDVISLGIIRSGTRHQEDCFKTANVICGICCDARRSVPVLSDSLLLLAHLTTKSPQISNYIRTSGALQSCLHHLERPKVPVHLQIASLSLAAAASLSNEVNREFILDRGVMRMAYGMVCEGNYSLRHMAIAFIDDITSQSAKATRQLVEHRSPDRSLGVIETLMALLHSNVRHISTGCIHGTVKCYGNCGSSSPPGAKGASIHDETTADALRLGPLAHVLQRAVESGNPKSESMEEFIEMRKVCMFDEIRLCNKRASICDQHGTLSAFLAEDEKAFRMEAETLISKINTRLSEAQTEALALQQIKEQHFQEFIAKIRLYMGQKNSPKELKNTSGARTLVAVSKVKLNKEQKKEMCMGALQKEKTMMHLLGDTYSQLYNDKVVRSTRYCDQDVDPPVIQIPSRKPEDYIDDIVLEDPVLNEMNKIAHKMKADSSTITTIP